MQPFSLFVTYLESTSTGSWKKMPPLLIQALNEEEAARTASAIADFACSELSKEILIQIVGSGESGRPIGEIRRPKSN